MRRVVLYPALVASIFLIGLGQLPWWLLIVPCALTGFFQTSWRQAFVDAFVTGFTVWAVVALLHDVEAGFRISVRIAAIFHLPVGMLAIIITGLIAGLPGGVAAVCGHNLRFVFPQNRNQN
jgi:hypothetical protein